MTAIVKQSKSKGRRWEFSKLHILKFYLHKIDFKNIFEASLLKQIPLQELAQ
jgi:hypothetical protein